MKLLAFVVIFLGSTQQASTHPASSFATTIAAEFKELLVDIRESRVPPAQAQSQFQNIMQRMHQLFPPTFTTLEGQNLVFPLRGYGLSAVGGGGSGFRSRGFNLFDQSVQGSHPAHDIFIYDRNQDSIDDRTGEYADVVAVSKGIVLATETDWQKDSEYRGGNYVWLYDVETGGLWYYAHQRKVYVEPGQWVEAGDKLAEVGRTGFNAAAPRSPTHLHLMYLHVNEAFLPIPQDFYPQLKLSRVAHSTQLPAYRNVFEQTIQQAVAQAAPAAEEVISYLPRTFERVLLTPVVPQRPLVLQAERLATQRRYLFYNPPAMRIR